VIYLDTTWTEFEGQNQRPKFKVTGGKENSATAGINVAWGEPKANKLLPV